MGTGTAIPASQELVLTVPAVAEQIMTVRLFANAAARAMDLDEGSAEVLRIVTTELASEAVERHAGGWIEMSLSAGRPLRASVSAGGGENGASAEDLATELRRSLLDALIPERSTEDDGERSVVTFVL